MATPVSKQIQVNRRSSFLDKLCKTVEEEKEEQRKKREKINKGTLTTHMDCIAQSFLPFAN